MPPVPAPLPRALFVCVQNAGRSQMAAAFWEALGGEARSAGSRPAAAVHPEVVTAMRERGIDLAGRVPRPLTIDDVRWADVAVTMGCGDVCPAVPGVERVDWELADPHGQGADAVRDIRDEVERRIRALAASARAAEAGAAASRS
jgi:arsenate reductase